jgi:hypothetical protein
MTEAQGRLVSRIAIGAVAAIASALGGHAGASLGGRVEALEAKQIAIEAKLDILISMQRHYMNGRE